MNARRVTANLPEALLREAREVTGRGITETLVEGLRLVKQRRAYTRFLALRGTLDLHVDLAESRERTRR